MNILSLNITIFYLIAVVRFGNIFLSFSESSTVHNVLSLTVVSLLVVYTSLIVKQSAKKSPVRGGIAIAMFVLTLIDYVLYQSGFMTNYAINELIPNSSEIFQFIFFGWLVYIAMAFDFKPSDKGFNRFEDIYRWNLN